MFVDEAKRLPIVFEGQEKLFKKSHIMVITTVNKEKTGHFPIRTPIIPGSDFKIAYIPQSTVKRMLNIILLEKSNYFRVVKLFKRFKHFFIWIF